jgi:hypothetical protein
MDAEDGAVAFVLTRGDLQAATVQVDDAAGQCQAQPAAFDAPRVCAAVQLFEMVRLVFGLNTRTAVGHFDDHRAPVFAGAHLHGVAWPGEFQRILDQVIKGQPQ